jgi:hypothetical protein
MRVLLRRFVTRAFVDPFCHISQKFIGKFKKLQNARITELVNREFPCCSRVTNPVPQTIQMVGHIGLAEMSGLYDLRYVQRSTTKGFRTERRELSEKP